MKLRNVSRINYPIGKISCFIEFYSSSPSVWLPVPAGSFAAFFPDDIHAPLGTDGQVHKVVVKIAVEWM
jgi:beta-galactosidase beta subunit